MPEMLWKIKHLRDIQERVVRHVSQDCLVAFEANRYSVPWKMAGKQVEVQSDGEMIKIFHRGELVVSHARLAGVHQTRLEQSHYYDLFRTVVPQSTYPDEVEVRDLAIYERLAEGGLR